MPKVETYQAMCSHCNWKRVSDQWDDLVAVPGCTACHGKKVKCPKCGFTVKARKYSIPNETNKDTIR